MQHVVIVVHLMIAGRFQWKEHGAPVPGKLGLAAFDFPAGTLLLTEAGSKKRASIHVVEGAGNLATSTEQYLWMKLCAAQAKVKQLEARA